MERMEVQLHSFLNLVLDGDEWTASGPGLYTHADRVSGTHEQEPGWVPESESSEESFAPAENRSVIPRSFSPQTGHYTYYANLAPHTCQFPEERQ